MNESDNDRRIDLIEKDIKTRSLTREETAELQRLEAMADQYLSSQQRSTEMDDLIERLKREGKWVESE